MKFYVVRGGEEELHLFIGVKPEKATLVGLDGERLKCWTSNGIETETGDYTIVELPPDMFPNLKWEDGPLEVKLTEVCNE